MKIRHVRAAVHAAISDLAPDGVKVHRSAPDKIAGSCMVLDPADDYISGPETYGGLRTATFDLVLIAKPGRNQTAIDQLDDLIDAVMTGLTDRADDIRQSSAVSGPARIDVAGALYLAATLQVAADYLPESD